MSTNNEKTEQSFIASDPAVEKAGAFYTRLETPVDVGQESGGERQYRTSSTTPQGGE